DDALVRQRLLQRLRLHVACRRARLAPPTESLLPRRAHRDRETRSRRAPARAAAVVASAGVACHRQAQYKLAPTPWPGRVSRDGKQTTDGGGSRWMSSSWRASPRSYETPRLRV